MTHEGKAEPESTQLPILRRMFRFASVGASGVLVNLAVFSVFRWAGAFVFEPAIAFQVAVAIGILVSIGTNFLLNDGWTWSDFSSQGSSRSQLGRFWRFYAVALVAGALNFGVARHLKTLALVSEYVAVLSGIACATAINFIVNHYWTFGRGRDQMTEKR